MARHRWVRIMVRYRWGLGLSLLVSLLVLVILAAVIIDRTVETPAEQLDQEKAQLDQELQLKPPPAYAVPDESDSSAFSCEPEELGYPYSSGCFNFVLTEATGAMKLASITEDILTTPALMTCCDYVVQRAGFFHKDEYTGDPGDSIATIYCFKSKSVAVSALRGALKDAELLGKTENCYLALYRGDAQRLKPWH